MEDKIELENTKLNGETSFCKYCQQEINLKAKVCHHCGKDQRFHFQYFASSTAFLMVIIAISQAVMGWLQYDESKMKRIEAEEVLAKAESNSKRVFGIASTNSYNSSKKAEEISLYAKNETAKAVAKSIEVLTIANDNALLAKNMTENSKTEMKNTVTAVNSQLKGSNSLIKKTSDEFVTIKTNVQSLKSETESQLRVLKGRNELMVLTDNATARGDRTALVKLKNIILNSEPNSHEHLAAISEFVKVKSFYLTAVRYSDGDLQYEKEKGSILKNDKIPIDILLKTLITSPDKVNRVKAARLLNNFKEKSVLNGVVYAINNDSNLDVVCAAVKSFNELTGSKNVDVLDEEPINEWMRVNKSKIENDFK